MKTPETEATKDGQPSGLAVAPCSAAWLRGADAAHKEEQFLEEPRNPYKPGTQRAKAWKEGYEQWLRPSSPNAEISHDLERRI